MSFGRTVCRAPSAAHSTYSESDLASVDSVFVDREPLHMTNVKAFTGSFESRESLFRRDCALSIANLLCCASFTQ